MLWRMIRMNWKKKKSKEITANDETSLVRFKNRDFRFSEDGSTEDEKTERQQNKSFMLTLWRASSQKRSHQWKRFSVRPLASLSSPSHVPSNSLSCSKFVKTLGVTVIYRHAERRSPRVFVFFRRKMWLLLFSFRGVFSYLFYLFLCPLGLPFHGFWDRFAAVSVNCLFSYAIKRLLSIMN